jgi:AraC-like DNA-binding protein
MLLPENEPTRFPNLMWGNLADQPGFQRQTTMNVLADPGTMLPSRLADYDRSVATGGRDLALHRSRAQNLLDELVATRSVGQKYGGLDPLWVSASADPDTRKAEAAGLGIYPGNTFSERGMAPSALKQKTGLAFVGWLTMKRMEKAQELLLMTDNRISEIANEVGFADEGYFTRRFKQKFNFSPSEFRARRRH